MRKFAVLGASAVVLALGVGQALAIPSTEQWQDHLSRMNGGAAYSTGNFADFRAQAPDAAYGSTYDQGPSLYHKGR